MCKFASFMKQLFTYPKADKLKNTKQIDALFQSGKSQAIFPVRAVYRVENSENPGVQVAVTVGKKHFKRAVLRNRVKRLLRECYRLEQHRLRGSENRRLQVMLLYQSNEILEFEKLRLVICKLFDKLAQDMQQKSSEVVTENPENKA